jgi:hypothetical protein
MVFKRGWDFDAFDGAQRSSRSILEKTRVQPGMRLNLISVQTSYDILLRMSSVARNLSRASSAPQVGSIILLYDIMQMNCPIAYKVRLEVASMQPEKCVSGTSWR